MTVAVAAKPSIYPMQIGARLFTREQTNQLLYLETRAVDHGGLCNGAQMNADDLAISDIWHTEGFLYFRRVAFAELHEANRYHTDRGSLTHLVVLSDEAWACAGELRKRRGQRTVKEQFRRSENPTSSEQK